MLLKLVVTQRQHDDDKGLCKKALGMNVLQTEKWEMGKLTNFPPTSLLPASSNNTLVVDKVTLTL